MSNFTTDVTVTIHGTEIDLIADGDAICPAEPDVGIMSPYIEGWELLFADGTPIPVGLQNLLAGKEYDKVQDALDEALARGDFRSQPGSPGSPARGS